MLISESFVADMAVQTMEVATARVYNWDVAERRKENVGSKGGIEGDSKSSPNG